MKVLLINGSPRANGNTARALKEVADTLAAEGVESEIFWIGNKPVHGCIACYQCNQKSLGRCAFDDDVAMGQFSISNGMFMHWNVAVEPPRRHTATDAAGLVLT